MEDLETIFNYMDEFWEMVVSRLQYKDDGLFALYRETMGADARAAWDTISHQNNQNEQRLSSRVQSRIWLRGSSWWSSNPSLDNVYLQYSQATVNESERRIVAAAQNLMSLGKWSTACVMMTICKQYQKAMWNICVLIWCKCHGEINSLYLNNACVWGLWKVLQTTWQPWWVWKRNRKVQ